MCLYLHVHSYLIIRVCIFISGQRSMLDVTPQLLPLFSICFGCFKTGWLTGRNSSIRLYWMACELQRVSYRSTGISSMHHNGWLFTWFMKIRPRFWCLARQAFYWIDYLFCLAFVHFRDWMLFTLMLQFLYSSTQLLSPFLLKGLIENMGQSMFQSVKAFSMQF